MDKIYKDKLNETNGSVGIPNWIHSPVDSSLTNSSGFILGHTSANNWANIKPHNTTTITSDNGKTTINTDKHTIDIDELAEMMEILKKRLLIIIPNFEKHEKYPMLKQLYDEYKVMETLLTGPDSNE